MRIYSPGNDKGNALLTALVLIFILSTVVMLLIQQVSTVRTYAQNYKDQVMDNIEQENRRVNNLYDIH